MPNGIVEFKDIYNKDPFVAPANLVGSEPATAANYGAFFTAKFPCEVMEFSAVWETASTFGNVQLERIQGTTAVGSGDLILSTAVDTWKTANTTNYGALVVGTVRILDRGDRLALRDAGTLTSAAGLQTETLIKPLGKGHYAAHGSAIL